MYSRSEFVKDKRTRTSNSPFDPFDNGDDANTPWTEFHDATFDTTFDSETSFDHFAQIREAAAAAKQFTQQQQTSIFSTREFDGDSTSALPPQEAPSLGKITVTTTSASATQEQYRERTIHIALHEELTCLYDASKQEVCIPSIQVQGSIHARVQDNPPTKETRPFHLVIQDEANHIQGFHFDSKYAALETDPTIHYKNIDKHNKKLISSKSHAQRILNVRKLASNNKDSNNKDSTSSMSKLASYTCTSLVRPIPLLVKSKIQLLNGGGNSDNSKSNQNQVCRVGIKIRSNPSNARQLSNVVVLMAVPPDVRGESVRLNRAGGVWDSMKRIVVWSFDTLKPGELCEVQAQFELLGNNNNDSDRSQQQSSSANALPNFPILVRCFGDDEQFTKIQVQVHGGAGGSQNESDDDIRLNLTKRVRIMHRKI